ncbi:gamma-glutamylcyclotransferase [Chlorogloeopsis sp. ULAP02]|uniref:gamma-glutamylcyclotransferase n=1 Tax=Chlorogloeopsis sp. ULAP02 TaxID=3107926 RepID=UPI00313487EC
MSKQGRHLHHSWIQSQEPANLDLRLQPIQQKEPMFYYFAYGSCMCPVDLKRSLGENTHCYVIGSGILKGYRLGFYRYSPFRKCGVLDIVKDPGSTVHGVLYQLPMRVSDRLDEREDVPHGGYRHEFIDIHCQGQVYNGVRTYVVVNKLSKEFAPNDWYFNVVLRGAVTCGLPEEYCWNLFNHMYQLQQKHQLHKLGDQLTH